MVTHRPQELSAPMIYHHVFTLDPARVRSPAERMFL